jgi:hypothetical protein
MGNSDNSPNDGKLSLDTSAPLWSAILTEISRGLPIAEFTQPNDLETAEVDAFTGLKPGPFTRVTVQELFLPGTVPTQEETSRMAVAIDEASGLLWQDGCVGPRVTRGFFDFSRVEADHENWQKANANWGARAARGSGVRGGPEGTRTSFFYNNSFAPFGRTWGAPFAPRELCPIPAPPPLPEICDPTLGPCPPPVDGFIELPDLRCLDLESAALVLLSDGLAVGEVRSRGRNENLVVEDTNPRAGEQLPPGTPVNINLRSRDRVDGCDDD